MIRREGFIPKEMTMESLKEKKSALMRKHFNNHFEDGADLGRGMAARVRTFEIESQGALVMKKMERKGVHTRINSVEQEFRIQEAAHSIIQKNQELLPRIKAPRPDAFLDSVGKNGEEEGYIVMERMKGETLQHALFKEALQSTSEGTHAFEEAKRSEYITNEKIVDQLSEEESLHIISTYYSPYLEFREKQAGRIEIGEKVLLDSRIATIQMIAEKLSNLSERKGFTDVIPKNEGKGIDDDLISQLKKAVLELHKSGVAHRDLGVWNIMFDGENFSIIDFGASYMNTNGEAISHTEMNDSVLLIEAGDENFADTKFLNDTAIFNILDLLKQKDYTVNAEKILESYSKDSQRILTQLERDGLSTDDLAAFIDSIDIETTKGLIQESAIHARETGNKGFERFKKNLSRHFLKTSFMLLSINSKKVAPLIEKSPLRHSLPTKDKQELERVLTQLNPKKD